MRHRRAQPPRPEPSARGRVLWAVVLLLGAPLGGGCDRILGYRAGAATRDAAGTGDAHADSAAFETGPRDAVWTGPDQGDQRPPSDGLGLSDAPKPTDGLDRRDGVRPRDGAHPRDATIARDTAARRDGAFVTLDGITALDNGTACTAGPCTFDTACASIISPALTANWALQAGTWSQQKTPGAFVIRLPCASGAYTAKLSVRVSGSNCIFSLYPRSAAGTRLSEGVQLIASANGALDLYVFTTVDANTLPRMMVGPTPLALTIRRQLAGITVTLDSALLGPVKLPVGPVAAVRELEVTTENSAGCSTVVVDDLFVGP